MVGYYCDTYEDYVKCISKHYPQWAPYPRADYHVLGYVLRDRDHYGSTQISFSSMAARYPGLKKYTAKRVLPW